MSVSQLQMGRGGGKENRESRAQRKLDNSSPISSFLNPFPAKKKFRRSGAGRLPRRFLRWIHEKLRSSGIGFQKLREAAAVSGWIICQVGRMASLVG